MAEAVEPFHLRFAVTAHLVPLVEPGDELPDARPDLVREVRRRRPDEGVDVVAGRLAVHRRGIYRYRRAVRRLTVVDLMLFGTVLLWALNVTVTKYVINHGFHPLAYATTRYLAATALFWAFTYTRERSFAIHLSDAKLVGLAGGLIFLNQVCFVYGIKVTNASTMGLLLGTTPIFIGIIATLVGLEVLGRRFWAGAFLSFLGVGLIASGNGGFSGRVGGLALVVATPLTWAAYSVAIVPLMRRYSPFRISALVLGIGWMPLAVAGAKQTLDQGFQFGWALWLAFAYAVVGPLFLTNILWFTAISRVGPSRAALFANLQPFFAVLFALVLLGEHLNRWEIIGGIGIGAGIVLERTRRMPPEPPGD
jgi:drug/metabolite transporter (DMT)-like permease